jgi:high affinity Mn2+ porin
LSCFPLLAIAQSDTAAAPERWRWDGQFTNVTQKHDRFHAPYSGDNSLQPDESAQETTDLTLYLGARVAPRTELWVNAELDQGFGLSNTLGAAGFPSGEAYKVGQSRPYLRLPRLFLRHTVDLGGEAQAQEGGANQLGGTTSADNLVLTLGKFSVVDVFDTNRYAHDPRADFLNWAVIDAGAFDYAADAWGYTFGAAAEWSQGAWTWRGGVFQLSEVPNAEVTGLHFGQHMRVAEAEHRHDWNGHPGKLKLLAFSNRANMGSYQDAVGAARPAGTPPDIASVRRVQSRSGWSLNLEQEASAELGLFFRASSNDGRKEAYEFTEINRSVSAGLALKGGRWGRANDTVGLAGVANGLSREAQAFFAAGGMGILIGDGALHYGPERIVESYYALAVVPHAAFTLDWQRLWNPAYNQDRGPVNVLGARLHAEF